MSDALGLTMAAKSMPSTTAPPHAGQRTPPRPALRGWGRRLITVLAVILVGIAVVYLLPYRPLGPGNYFGAGRGATLNPQEGDGRSVYTLTYGDREEVTFGFSLMNKGWLPVTVTSIDPEDEGCCALLRVTHYDLGVPVTYEPSQPFDPFTLGRGGSAGCSPMRCSTTASRTWKGVGHGWTR